jgi:hypothetical protein
MQLRKYNINVTTHTYSCSRVRNHPKIAISQLEIFLELLRVMTPFVCLFLPLKQHFFAINGLQIRTWTTSENFHLGKETFRINTDKEIQIRKRFYIGNNVKKGRVLIS